MCHLFWSWGRSASAREDKLELKAQSRQPSLLFLLLPPSRSKVVRTSPNSTNSDPSKHNYTYQQPTPNRPPPPHSPTHPHLSPIINNSENACSFFVWKKDMHGFGSRRDRSRPADLLFDLISCQISYKNNYIEPPILPSTNQKNQNKPQIHRPIPLVCPPILPLLGTLGYPFKSYNNEIRREGIVGRASGRTAGEAKRHLPSTVGSGRSFH